MREEEEIRTRKNTEKVLLSNGPRGDICSNGKLSQTEYKIVWF